MDRVSAAGKSATYNIREASSSDSQRHVHTAGYGIHPHLVSCAVIVVHEGIRCEAAYTLLDPVAHEGKCFQEVVRPVTFVKSTASSPARDDRGHEPAARSAAPKLRLRALLVAPVAGMAWWRCVLCLRLPVPVAQDWCCAIGPRFPSWQCWAQAYGGWQDSSPNSSLVFLPR